MDLHKLNPWNWFKHEESGKGGREIFPVKHDDQVLSTEPLASNINQLHHEINRLFEDAFRGFGLSAGDQSARVRPFFSDDIFSAFRANVNVASNDRQYTITLEAPGLAQDNLSIELKDRVLVIKGNKQLEQEEKDQHYYRKERRYGAFERVLAVPDDADIDAIHARMERGLLTIDIPRIEVGRSDVKKIAIKNDEG